MVAVPHFSLLRSTHLSRGIISGLVAIADGLAVLGSGLVIYVLYVGWTDEMHLTYFAVSAIYASVTITAFYIANLYKFAAIMQPLLTIKTIFFLSVAIILVFFAAAFALKVSAQFSRIWVFSWFLCATILICGGRICASFLLNKWTRAGKLARNIAIVGAGEQARKLLEHLHADREPWNVIIGIFDDRGANRIGSEALGHPILGSVNDLLDFVRAHRVDKVIIALPWSADRRLLTITEKLRELPIDLSLGSDLVGFTYPGRSYSSLSGVTMLDIAHNPLNGWKAVVKELEDKILALLLLILFTPLMLLIALGIKLESRGPMIFRQLRYGYNNEVFSVFKFRTMYHNRASEKDVPQARRNDPRITRIGRFLRRLSLDELPQIFNVLQGTMSLVGPRPHAVPHNEEYAAIIGGYFARHRMKPGITGWAQVKGLRGETDDPEKMKARVEHDIHYTDHWSLPFDLQILAMTVYVVLSQNNAH